MIMIPEGYMQQAPALKKVIIPSTVKSIGKNAFYSCEALTEVIFAEGSQLKSIGDSAFSTTALTSLSLPGTVETVGNYAFAYTDVVNLTLPDSIVTLGDCAFYNCDKLVTLKAAGQTIGNSAFGGCDKLTTVTFAEGVETIGEYAFSYCVKLLSITFPESLKIMGGSLLSDCTALKSFTVPANVIEIGGTLCVSSGVTKVYFAEPEGWSKNFSDPQKAASYLKDYYYSGFSKD
jgi:hypothetical protein